VVEDSLGKEVVRPPLQSIAGCSGIYLSCQTTWKAEISQLEQNSLHELISMEKTLGIVVCTCHPSNDQKSGIKESLSRLTWAKTRAHLQNNQSKKSWSLGSRDEAPA
jgi:hypothetical protein